MGNLKLKIVLTAVMLVFAIVPAVIVGAIGTFSVMGYERSAKENTLQQVGESKSAGIKQAFKSYSSIVGAIAKLTWHTEWAALTRSLKPQSLRIRISSI